MFFQCRWGRSHSAYISESITVHYRFCDLFGSSLAVLRRMRRSDGDWVICETPQGNALALPGWMTDPTICSRFSLGLRAVSLSALCELRLFLDALHSSRECDKPSRNTSPMERLDEPNEKGESDGNVLRAEGHQRSTSSRTGARSAGGARKRNNRVTTNRGAQRQRRGPNGRSRP
jgi:hypothetical protein